MKKKLTEEEKARRRHERSAEKKNAKIQAEIPLFASQIETHTADGEYWHWRRNKAKAAEHMGALLGSKMLNELLVRHAIRPFASSVVGDEAFEKLDAHCRRVYQSVSYWYRFWCGVLTGERQIYGWKKVEASAEYVAAHPLCRGFRVEEDGAYQHQHMTREEFYARFPYEVDEPWEAPEDGGLGELVGEVIRKAKERSNP